VLISTIVGIWMSVALIGSVRLLPNLHAVFALRDRCVPFPVDIESRLPLWLEAKQQGRRTGADDLRRAAWRDRAGSAPSLHRSAARASRSPDDRRLDQVILHEHSACAAAR
jgi:hypothetical protein